MPIIMTTILGGLVGTTGVVGFGSLAPGGSLLGGTIDLTGGADILLNCAFSVRREGTITSIATYYSNVLALALVRSPVTITAQLYRATTPNNFFTSIQGAVATLTLALTRSVVLVGISNAIATGLSIPVTAQTRLLMVFS
ncbi:exosporium glycoprotein BclB-related protein [Clostridium sp.]|uniref:exosporium glycoprotein BclB-related protein n=1 Tax=Clostridium sp. TaxID=1506 RepID=UPI003FD8CA53